MSGDVVIRAVGLGKKYVIGHRSAERMPTLRDTISRASYNFVRSVNDLIQGQPMISGDEIEEFWALSDVSFEINRGDVVGIIGRNGAGKSTLLRVLSRITEPSTGRVEIKGRVASLLEVGTGFHPELTGRENIYLNGAILSMTRAEIRRKFDEIVDFAGIERFLDTPVKRYSSGMYVRLAFAVAAHLEPEVLIVDEVLAVGDAEFQKKCLGKMGEVAGLGRTVLFVSHNMSSVQALCSSGILLASGRIVAQGPTTNLLQKYLSRNFESLSTGARIGPNLRIISIDHENITVSGERFDLHINLELMNEVVIYHFSVLILTESGLRLSVLDGRETLCVPLIMEQGAHSIIFDVESLNLVGGSYSIGLYIETDCFNGDLYDLSEFRVVENVSDNCAAPYASKFRGFVNLKSRAHIRASPD